MATVKTNSSQKTVSRTRTKPRTGSYKKKSHSSILPNGANPAGPQEVPAISSRLSNDYTSSTATFINSLSLLGAHVNRNTIRPNGINVAKTTASDALPATTPFGNQSAQLELMPQQIHLDNAPIYNFTGYELRILPTPRKSCVETPIPIKMIMSSLPPGVTRLHLPPHTISKPKLLARSSPERSSNTLELQVSLVCSSAIMQVGLKKKALERAATVPQDYLPDLDDAKNSPQNGGDVRICTGCIKRERKQAARKEVKKPEEEDIWSQDEERRVLVFNTREVEGWQPSNDFLDPSRRPGAVIPPSDMQIDAPIRIACYCRHHGEKIGFNAIFTIKDFQGRVVAQAMSNPIMITDNDKIHPIAQVSHPQVSETVTSTTAPLKLPQAMDSNNSVPNVQNGVFIVSQTNDGRTAARGHRQKPYEGSTSGETHSISTFTISNRTASRPASPNQGGSTKKINPSGPDASNGLTVMRLQNSPTSSPTSPQLSTETRPFALNSSPFQQFERMSGPIHGQTRFANGTPSPDITNQLLFFNCPPSMDNAEMVEPYSTPIPGHPSRSSSPDGSRNGLANKMQNQFTTRLVANQYSRPLGVNQMRTPVIYKVIPNEGPKFGGVEISLLGAGFSQGLEVWFGEQKATTTTYWSDSSLVCLLPFSPVAGTVMITFKHQDVIGTKHSVMGIVGMQLPTFKYIDNDEDMLIRTALSVLGRKMSGQMVEVIDLARRILYDGN